MLIILGGLPGTGKTSLARLLSRRLGALHLRIDTIEQALRSAGRWQEAVGTAGYAIAQQLAIDNLRLGHRVIADCVNPVAASRDGWRAAALQAGVPAMEIEMICSDPAEHRRRVEMRQADIAGHVLPSWQSVMTHIYEPWPSALVVDSAGKRIEAIAEALVARLENTPARPAAD